MTAAAWATGLAIVAAIWATALRARAHHRRSVAVAWRWHCMACGDTGPVMHSDADMDADYRRHSLLRHMPAPRGVDL